MPIEWSVLIRAIAVPASVLKGPVTAQVNRNETVIKLLKHFDLDPDHPPEKFRDVYAYALVEYGIGKSEPMLELLRRNEFQEIFLKAFNNNSFQQLLQETEQFVSDYESGKVSNAIEVAAWRGANIDPKREFLDFTRVFIEVAKRTRTPKEVLQDNKIDSLRQGMVELHQQLERLPTLEAMRTEMARFADQAIPALPATEAELC